MALERFCRKPVITMLSKQSIHDAALKMRDHHVGAVLVVDDDRPSGSSRIGTSSCAPSSRAAIPRRPPSGTS